MNTTVSINDELELTPVREGNKFLSEIFGSISMQERTVSILSVAEGLYTGKTLKGWSLPGIEGEPTHTHISFHLSSDGLPEIKSIAITYEFAELSLTLVAREFDNHMLVFRNQDGTSVEKSLFPDLAGRLKLHNYLAAAQLPSFLNLTDFSYEVHVYLISGKLTAMHKWIASQSELQIEALGTANGVFLLSQMKLTSLISFDLESPITPVNYFLQGSIDLGKQCDIRLAPGTNNQFQLDITAEDGLPTLADIAGVLHLDGVHEAMEALYAEVGLLNALIVNSIRLYIDINRLKINQIQLTGNVTVSDYKFLFSLHFPQFHFFTRLSPETAIPVGRIFHDHFPAGLGMPSGMNISQLALSAQLSPKRFGILATISDLWQFSLGATAFHLEQLQFELQKTIGQSAKGHVRAQLQIGTLDIALSAGNDADSTSAGWLFSTEIAHKADLSLQQMMGDLGQLFHFDTPGWLPDILIHEIDLSFHTSSHHFHFNGTATLNEAMGPVKKGEIYLSLDLEKNAESNRHQVSVLLEGNVTISDTLVAFKADLGKSDWSLHIDWNQGDGKPIDLLDLARLSGSTSTFPSVPEKVKEMLSLSSAEFNYHHEASTFNATVTTTGGASVVLAGSKESSNWGFLFGIGYQKPEDIPTLGESLKPIVEEIELENFWFLINTFENSATKPKLPQAFPHQLDPAKIGKGLAAMATLQLNSSHRHRGFNELKQHLPATELTFLAAASEKDGTAGITLYAGLSGEVEIPTGQGNHLVLEDCGLQLDWHGAHIGLQLQGTVHFTLDHVPITTLVGLDINEQGADVRMKLAFDEGWKLFGLDQVILDELDLLVGVVFEPPGVELGLQGAMHLEGEETKADQLGVVLEFVGEIPNPEYFALSIKEINLSSLLTMFTGGSAHGNSQVTNTLKASNLSVYWAERALTLPDGTTARPGFGLHGEFDILGWKAYAHLDAHTDTGISGHAETSAINWHILKLSGNGQGVYGHEYWDETEGTWMRIDNTGSKKISENTRTRTVELVPPGGPMIHFDSNHSPFIAISIHAQLFGILSSEFDLEVTDHGFDFNLHFEVPYITNLRLDCHLAGNSFTANGSFFAGLDFDIPTIFGEIDIELGIYADMDLAVGASISDFVLALEGGIDVMGVHIPFARVNMSNPPQRLEQVPLWLAMHFAESVFPPFHELFQDAYDELNKLPAEFDEQSYNDAVKLRNMAREWAALVHADIREIQSERGLSPQAAEVRAIAIETQATDIKQRGSQHVIAVEKTGASEQSQLQAQAQKINSIGQDRREKSNTQRQVKIDRMLREIKDLTDSEDLLRNAVEAIFNEHQADLEIAERLVNEALEKKVENADLLNEQQSRLSDLNDKITKAQRAIKAADDKIMNVLRKYPPNSDKKAVAAVKQQLETAKNAKAAAQKQLKSARTAKRKMEEEISRNSSDLVDQQTGVLSDINNKINTALDALKLTAADEEAYPDTPGKFTPKAVDHFAEIIRTNRRGAIQEALILQEARRQARAILNRAHTTVRSFSLTQNP